MLTFGSIVIALTAVSRADDTPAAAKASNPVFEKVKRLAGT